MDDQKYLAPDDSGLNWKPIQEWTEEEIHNLVIEHVGRDETFARGYSILIMLWSPPKVDEYGLEYTEQSLRNKSIESTMGLILRMGADAFTDGARFPSGPLVTYGEWGIFRGGQRQVMEVDGKKIAFVTDDRFIGVTLNPTKITTGIQLEHDWAGQ